MPSLRSLPRRPYVFWTDDPAANAPRLDYRVNFTSAETFYLFIRGDAGHRFWGLGLVLRRPRRQGYPNLRVQQVHRCLGWQGEPIEVAATGIHVVKVFAREDGFRVDKLVIHDVDTAPSGTGPDESLL